MAQGQKVYITGKYALLVVKNCLETFCNLKILDRLEYLIASKYLTILNTPFQLIRNDFAKNNRSFTREVEPKKATQQNKRAITSDKQMREKNFRTFEQAC